MVIMLYLWHYLTMAEEEEERRLLDLRLASPEVKSSSNIVRDFSCLIDKGGICDVTFTSKSKFEPNVIRFRHDCST